MYLEQPCRLLQHAKLIRLDPTHSVSLTQTIYPNPQHLVLPFRIPTPNPDFLITNHYPRLSHLDSRISHLASRISNNP
jgi:hypothetical protein